MGHSYGLGAQPPMGADRAATRAALLDAVEVVRPVIEAHRDETSRGGTLAPAVVEALRSAGLFAFKSPRAVGGAEAHPVDQMDVIDAVTRIDPAAGWSMFIGAAVTGSSAALLSDEGVNILFAGGRCPIGAGSLKPDGRAERVEGGYRITGRWAWGSGVRHADFARVMAPVEGGGMVGASVPIADVTVHDNWHVMGMEGTGSCDYSLQEVVVPEHLTIDSMNPVQQRGGALYRMGMPGYVVNEHMIFALALAGMALEELQHLAANKRGYGGGTSIGDRAVVQRLVSEGNLRLRALRLLCDEVLEQLFEASEQGPPPGSLVAEARAVGTLCTDEAVQIVGAAFRHCGGSAVYRVAPIQQYLRDVYAVQSHFVVNDSSYEQHGQMLLGSADGPSMA